MLITVSLWMKEPFTAFSTIDCRFPISPSGFGIWSSVAYFGTHRSRTTSGNNTSGKATCICSSNLPAPSCSVTSNTIWSPGCGSKSVCFENPWWTKCGEGTKELHLIENNMFKQQFESNSLNICCWATPWLTSHSLHPFTRLGKGLFWDLYGCVWKWWCILR